MISLLLPTRGRPSELARMVSSVRATAKTNVQIVLYVDDDDGTDYAAFRNDATIKVGPRIRQMTRCWNEIVPLATGDIFCLANDDIIFRTQGWDLMVEAAFSGCADKILLVHGDDLGGQRERFGPHPFISRRWVETVGYFLPPYFSSEYGDTWLAEVANAVGRRKFLPFVVEHMHFCWGKAEQDQVTRDRLARGDTDHVDDLWHKLEPERQKDIAKLRAVIKPPKWSILILTQPSRSEYLKRILSILEPQLRNAAQVQLVVQMFDDTLSLGANREKMRREATGEYINFIDDDDVVPADYVEKILPLLDGVDYIGFRVQCFVDGVPFSKTFHSLQHAGWFSDAEFYYRDISHINPMLRKLALQSSMEGGFAEDQRWGDALRKLKIVRTEHYIDDVMYLYYSRTVKDDETFNFDGPDYRRAFADLDYQEHPSVTKPPERSTDLDPIKLRGRICPGCTSECTLPFANGTRCNQCGLQF